MNLFRSVGILGSLVLAVLVGCSNAAREASRNDAPVAQVTLTMANAPAHVGTELQARYEYSDGDGDKEGGTVKVWLRNGEPIAGADQDIYTATVADSGSKLQYRVTPAAASGKSPGAAVLSPEITIENSPPRITGLVIGNNLSGQAEMDLTANYSFHDLDGNGEGASTYQWLRDGVAIGGGINEMYTLTYLDAGATITVKVTPFANAGASPGLPMVSNAVKVASPNAVLTVSASLKQLHFNWVPVRGASMYRLSYNPDGVSGFVPLSADSSNLTVTTYGWDIAAHRLNWPKAQFMLEACDSSRCLPSANVNALDVMANTIGYFKASNTEANDYFGASVALSADGNTLAVGAYNEDSSGSQLDDCTATLPVNCAIYSGAVYVYMRNGGIWSQQAYLKASNPGAFDYFGISVALSGDGATLAVGAYLEDGANTGVTSGAPGETIAPNGVLDSGAVYVFTRNAALLWSQQAYVKAANPKSDNYFGSSLTLSADGLTLAVGAPYESGASPSPFNSGAVYVFTRSPALLWSQQAYLKAGNPGAGDRFGGSVALSSDGNTLAVGARYEDGAKTGVTPGAPDETAAPNDTLTTDSGAVYVFTRNAALLWSQQVYVKASNTGATDEFGVSVALSSDGSTLAVGAWGEDSAKTSVTFGAPSETAAPNDALTTNSGAVYVFTRNAALLWSQQAYVKASNTGAYDSFGGSLALSDDGATLAVGVYSEDGANPGVTQGTPNETDAPNGASTSQSGAAYLFTHDGTLWSQQAYVKASNTGAFDLFGTSLALSADGNTLAVGAYSEDSAAAGVNNTAPGQGDNSAGGAGAVYLY